MELGQYGWNRQVKMFQQHTVFLERPAPATSSYGVLNIGDAPFDGVSQNKFSGAALGTALAINTGTTFNGNALDVQSGGARLFSINVGSGGVVLSNYATLNISTDPPVTNQQGLASLGLQFFSGAGQFAGSANGTYLAINSQSGFGGFFIDVQAASVRKFSVDSFGNIYGASSVSIAASPSANAGFGLYNAGAGTFSGSASGTVYAAATGAFAGNLADWQVNGVSQFAVSATGAITRYAASTPANGQLLIGNTTNGNFSLATLTAGTGVTVTNAPGSITIASTGGGGGSLTTASNTVGTNVTMTNANQFYDGPSVSLAAGTWYIVGTVTVNSTNDSKVTAKLWDGTTAVSSAEVYQNAATSCSPTVAGIVTPSVTTTYKMSAASNVAGGVVRAATPDNAAGNNASGIWAVRIDQGTGGASSPTSHVFDYMMFA